MACVSVRPLPCRAGENLRRVFKEDHCFWHFHCKRARFPNCLGHLVYSGILESADSEIHSSVKKQNAQGKKDKMKNRKKKE